MKGLTCLLMLALAGCEAESQVNDTLQAVAPDVAAVDASSTKEVKSAVGIGSAAPAFKLPGSDGRTHSLSDYVGQHVVLAFFPKAFTGG